MKQRWPSNRSSARSRPGRRLKQRSTAARLEEVSRMIRRSRLVGTPSSARSGWYTRGESDRFAKFHACWTVSAAFVEFAAIRFRPPDPRRGWGPNFTPMSCLDRRLGRPGRIGGPETRTESTAAEDGVEHSRNSASGVPTVFSAPIMRHSRDRSEEFLSRRRASKGGAPREHRD